MNRTVDLLFEILVRSGPRKSNDSGSSVQRVWVVGKPTSSRILSLKVIAERFICYVDYRPWRLGTHCSGTQDQPQGLYSNSCIYSGIAIEQGRGKELGYRSPVTCKRKLCARSYLRAPCRESSFLVQKATGAVSGDCSAVGCWNPRAVPDRIKVTVRTVGCLGVGHGLRAFAAKAGPVGLRT